MGSPTVIVRACIISLSQTSGCVGWVAHRLLVSCSVLGVAVKPVLLTYLLTTVCMYMVAYVHIVALALGAAQERCSCL